MAVVPSLLRRGTRASFTTQRNGSGLVAYQAGYLTDEKRIVVPTATGAADELPTLDEATLACVGFIFDGGGSALTTGLKAEGVRRPGGFTGVPIRWDLEADASGSIVIDLRAGLQSAGDISTATSICASAKPTLSSARQVSSGAVTGWSNIPAWARLVPNIDSVSGLNWAHLTLWFRKTAA